MTEIELMRLETIEECAKVCEESQTAYGVVAKNLAKKLRKLKPWLPAPGTIQYGNVDPDRALSIQEPQNK